MADGAVGQDVDQTRHLAVDVGPVVAPWAGAARRRGRSAGMCSSRLVEPPKAACTTMALWSAASVRMSPHREPACVEVASRARRGPRAMSSQIGWPEGRARSAAGTCPAPRRRPAPWPPCRGTGSRRRAWRRRGSPSRRPRRSVISPWAKRAPMRLDLAGVFAFGRRQGDTAGHEHAGQIGSCPPGPSSWRAGPCRRWPRP